MRHLNVAAATAIVEPCNGSHRRDAAQRQTAIADAAGCQARTLNFGPALVLQEEGNGRGGAVWN